MQMVFWKDVGDYVHKYFGVMHGNVHCYSVIYKIMILMITYDIYAIYGGIYVNIIFLSISSCWAEKCLTLIVEVDSLTPSQYMIDTNNMCDVLKLWKKYIHIFCVCMHTYVMRYMKTNIINIVKCLN